MTTREIKGRAGHCLAENETLIECLARHFELTPERSEWLMTIGAVYLDRVRVLSDCKLTTGQYVRVHFEPRRYAVESVDWQATVVHHDEQFVIVNKPAGIPVHPTLDNRIENVAFQLAAALGLPLFVTQRLDANVGGLLVLAKTREYQSEFNRLLLERKVKKRYRALVTTPPPLGRHVHYMEPTERGPKTVSAEPKPGWLECVLTVVNIGAIDIEIDLETGRTHQIRAQLSALGSPIVGDTQYGSNVPYHPSAIGLFSAATSWSDGTRANWSFALSPPWFSNPVTI